MESHKFFQQSHAVKYEIDATGINWYSTKEQLIPITVQYLKKSEIVIQCFFVLLIC